MNTDTLDKALISDKQLNDVKTRLKVGKLTHEDIKVLEGLVIKTEEAAKSLRAAIVE